jgi:energy-coupling factor transporter ATP-binding protein EcfA2
MESEIDCVGITDHNTGAWIDKLKSTYASMKSEAEAGRATPGFRDIHLFPGVELSVNGGFHLLALFDPTCSSQTIDQLIGAVGYDGTPGNPDGVTREGAAKVMEEVIRRGGIPILAHADDANGLLEVENGTQRPRLDANTILQALEVPGLLGMEWRDLSKPLPRIAEDQKLVFSRVLGSDCHNFRGSKTPGSRFSWVKMASPKIEGLRLALLDGQEFSIRRSDDDDTFNPIRVPEHVIESIEVREARWMGRGREAAKFHFTPAFNALIGGRGTGKSTVLHAFRLAFNRKDELEPGTEPERIFNDFNQVPKLATGTGCLRSETALLVTLLRDGQRLQLKWENKKLAVFEWNAVAQEFQLSESQLVTSKRFPVLLFSQGQISALAGESQATLLGIIDEAACANAGWEHFQEACSTFLATRAQLRDLSGRLKGREPLAVSITDVMRKLERFEGAHHAEVLKSYQLATQQVAELDRQIETLEELGRGLMFEAERLMVDNFPRDLFNASEDAEVLAMHKEMAAAVSNASNEVNQAGTDLLNFADKFKDRLKSTQWRKEATRRQSAYEDLKASLQAQGVQDPSDFGKLVDEKKRLDGEMSRLEALKKQRDGLVELSKVQLEAVLQARRGISQLRALFLEQTLAGNSYVRMRLCPYGHGITAAEQSLRELLGISDGRFAEDIFVESQDNEPAHGVMANLKNIPSQPGFEQAETIIRQIQKELWGAARDEGALGSRLKRYLKGEADKHPELLDRIFCWFPEDGLQVEYSRKGNGKDFQPIGQASAGQRAAAMLAFLLAHGEEPLVLDQPEDDLDNHLIYDLIVRQIRTQKQRRQLIIVTHNPNIVVNGDAEFVHTLGFNNQCYISQSGSLQDEKMRQEICLVMEGGRDAFERRYRRLGQLN